MVESRARDTADLNATVEALPTFADAAALTNRNLLYNGAMQVAQRGTSTASITTAGYYTVDRYLFEPASMGTWTMSVENDAPTGSGFGKSTKILCTTADASPAASDNLNFQTRIEGQDLQRVAKGTPSAQELTLSFWVKSNVTGTYIAELYDGNNTRQVSASYTVSVSATWERKTITFPADATGAFTNNNGLSLYVVWHLGGGSDFTSGTLNTVWATPVSANRAAGQTNLAAATDNYWQVTGVQLEVGAVATPFEFKSYGQELRECQRYYYRITGDEVSHGLTLLGHVQSSNNVSACPVPFPVTMRIEPILETTETASDYNVGEPGISNVTCNSLPVLNIFASRFTGFVTGYVASGLTAGNSALIRTGVAGAYLGFSAEL